MAHGSGFRWGADRLPEDFGFRFAPSLDEAEAPVPAEPPAHPSGFTWADHDEGQAPVGTDAAPTAGVFRWANPLDAPVFVWRAPADRPPVFRWKD